MSEPLLMILTSHRLDCLKLTMELLDRTNSINEFDKIVFLLNGVTRTHLHYIQRWIKEHPEIPCDTVSGPRGRSECISSLENQCIERYPNRVYVKIDEDIFVSNGWASRLLETYKRNQNRPNLALITPLIPNNAFGLYQLLTRFYPEYGEDYVRLFGEKPALGVHSKIWSHPAPAEWSTRLFINLNVANESHRRRLAQSNMSSEFEFTDPFSIGCICFDYRHWQRMGGIPETDEPGWTSWIQENGQTNILDCSQIVLHYSFFVQQEWLDRTSLLEDIRAANLPGTLSLAQRVGLARMKRIAKQIPGVIRRRIERQ